MGIILRVKWVVVELASVEADRKFVSCKNVGRAVVKPVVAIQGERHLKKAIVAIEADKAWTAILESGHGPQSKDIA
jgi:hypothetical protein